MSKKIEYSIKIDEMCFDHNYGFNPDDNTNTFYDNSEIEIKGKVVIGDVSRTAIVRIRSIDYKLSDSENMIGTIEGHGQEESLNIIFTIDMSVSAVDKILTMRLSEKSLDLRIFGTDLPRIEEDHGYVYSIWFQHFD